MIHVPIVAQQNNSFLIAGKFVMAAREVSPCVPEDASNNSAENFMTLSSEDNITVNDRSQLSPELYILWN